jgi:hypothetical protein
MLFCLSVVMVVRLVVMTIINLGTRVRTRARARARVCVCVCVRECACMKESEGEIVFRLIVFTAVYTFFCT